MNILVSACLLGVNCKYSGKNNRCPALCDAAALGRVRLIPVCPEQLGGLPTPRPPAECRGQQVVTQTGTDVTDAFLRGAREAGELCRLYNCKTAILKQNSPSCGSRTLYDGSFSGVLTPGEGVTAALLRQNGVTVLDETQAAPFLAELLLRQP